MKYVALLAVVSGGCAVVGADDGGSDGALEQDSSTSYVLIQDFAKVDQGAWYDVRSKLNANFDDVCGDTFCEGDFSNITPLTFGCTVTSKAGDVKDCVWTFAASEIDVDAKTASLQVDAPTFQCHVKAPTTAVKLVAALSGAADALHVALPGGAPSIYDQLGDCFEHPIGATSPVLTNPPTATYVAGSQYYTSASGRAKWSSAIAALKLGFDNICGDTFCGSDFGDLQSMQFECAVTKSSGAVKGCAWVFGGSYDVPGKATTLATSQSFSCPVAVGAGTTISTLLATWNVAGPQAAIDRPLPGKTTSAYDALGGCLP